jgi:hypothetical protein
MWPTPFLSKLICNMFYRGKNYPKIIAFYVFKKHVKAGPLKQTQPHNRQKFAESGHPG